MYNKKFHVKRQNQPHYKIMADTIIKFQKYSKTEFNSVLDIGCSCGVLLAEFPIKKKAGIDFGKAGQFFPKEAGTFIEHDFETGHKQLDEKYDLIICMEVVEHIEQIYEQNLFRTILYNSHPNTTLVFSGAHEGQRGRNHVNCRDSDYWLKQINLLNRFRYSSIMTNHYIASCGSKIPRCYLENTMIFK